MRLLHWGLRIDRVPSRRARHPSAQHQKPQSRRAKGRLGQNGTCCHCCCLPATVPHRRARHQQLLHRQARRLSDRAYRGRVCHAVYIYTDRRSSGGRLFAERLGGRSAQFCLGRDESPSSIFRKRACRLICNIINARASGQCILVGNDGVVAMLCTCMVTVRSECKGTRALAKNGFWGSYWYSTPTPLKPSD